jgi:hypothetical protein
MRAFIIVRDLEVLKEICFFSKKKLKILTENLSHKTGSSEQI